jgi:hypothetical protein
VVEALTKLTVRQDAVASPIAYELVLDELRTLLEARLEKHGGRCRPPWMIWL